MIASASDALVSRALENPALASVVISEIADLIRKNSPRTPPDEAARKWREACASIWHSAARNRPDASLKQVPAWSEPTELDRSHLRSMVRQALITDIGAGTRALATVAAYWCLAGITESLWVAECDRAWGRAQ